MSQRRACVVCCAFFLLRAFRPPYLSLRSRARMGHRGVSVQGAGSPPQSALNGGRLLHLCRSLDQLCGLSFSLLILLLLILRLTKVRSPVSSRKTRTDTEVQGSRSRVKGQWQYSYVPGFQALTCDNLIRMGLEEFPTKTLSACIFT